MAGRTTIIHATDSHPELQVHPAPSTSGLSMLSHAAEGGEVSASPQGKGVGVGVFALGSSPGDNGLNMEDEIKDPKVTPGPVVVVYN